MSEQVKIEQLEEVTTLNILGLDFNMYGDIKSPIFLAADVAAMIDYSQDKVGQMLDCVDDDEKLTDTIFRGGQSRKMWFLTEFGLYELLLQSRKPLAKTFKTQIKQTLKKMRLKDVVTCELNGNVLTIENAKLLFRNFAGEERTYNAKGDRNFCLVLEDEVVRNQLINAGWNVKQLKPREEGEEGTYYIQVTVRYDNFPPKAYMVTKRNTVLMDENTVENLDLVEIAKCDVAVSGSRWENTRGSGVKAYLKSMYLTVQEDAFAEKYAIRGNNEPEELPFD